MPLGTASVRSLFLFPLLFSFSGCRSVFSITGIRQPRPPFVRLSSPALACLPPDGDLFCGVRHCQGYAPSRPLIPVFPVPDGLHVPLRTARARALPSAHPGAGLFPETAANKPASRIFFCSPRDAWEMIPNQFRHGHFPRYGLMSHIHR